MRNRPARKSFYIFNFPFFILPARWWAASSAHRYQRSVRFTSLRKQNAANYTTFRRQMQAGRSQQVIAGRCSGISNVRNRNFQRWKRKSPTLEMKISHVGNSCSQRRKSVSSLNFSGVARITHPLPARRGGSDISRAVAPQRQMNPVRSVCALRNRFEAYQKQFRGISETIPRHEGWAPVQTSTSRPS